MSLINKEIGEFTAQAFVNGEFKTVTKEDLLGKWNVLFFYPADFTFICPTELEDLQNNYAKFQEIGCEIYPFPPTRTSLTRRGMTPPSVSRRSPTRCSPDPTHVISKDPQGPHQGGRPGRARHLRPQPRGQGRSLRGERRQHRP